MKRAKSIYKIDLIVKIKIDKIVGFLAQQKMKMEL